MQNGHKSESIQLILFHVFRPENRHQKSPMCVCKWAAWNDKSSVLKLETLSSNVLFSILWIINRSDETEDHERRACFDVLK